MATAVGIFGKKFSDCTIHSKDGSSHNAHAVILYEFAGFRDQLDAGKVVVTEYTKKQLNILLKVIYKTIALSDPEDMRSILDPVHISLGEIVDLCRTLTDKWILHTFDRTASNFVMWTMSYIWSNLGIYESGPMFLPALKEAVKLPQEWIDKQDKKDLDRKCIKYFDTQMMLDFLGNAAFRWDRVRKLSFVMKWSCIQTSENSKVPTTEVYESLCRTIIDDPKKKEHILNLPFRKVPLEEIKKHLGYGLCPIVLMYLVQYGIKIDLKNIKREVDTE